MQVCAFTVGLLQSVITRKMNLCALKVKCIRAGAVRMPILQSEPVLVHKRMWVQRPVFAQEAYI